MLGTGRIFFDAGDGFLVAEYALMGAAGVGEEDGDDKWPISRLLLLVHGFWIFDARYWMLDTGCLILDAGCWILDPGFWMLDA